MPLDQEFTFKQLTQIALGGPTLSPYHISILHYLINLLLQKADSTNETVTIGGFESKHLEHLLYESKNVFPSVVPKTVESSVEKLNKLNEMEEQLNDIEEKLEKHFDIIRQKYKKNTRCLLFDWDYWEHYDTLCEDLCNVCEEKNKTACQLLQNKDFVKKLIIGISVPLVDKMIEFEKQIEITKGKLNEFFVRMEYEISKVECIPVLVYKIEQLRFQIALNDEKFETNLKEIQQMLNIKLDKIHIPPLKIFFKDRIEKLQKELKKMEKQSDCPKFNTKYDGQNICLSCNISTAKNDIKTQKTPTIISKICDCKPIDITSSSTKDNTPRKMEFLIHTTAQ